MEIYGLSMTTILVIALIIAVTNMITAFCVMRTMCKPSNAHAETLPASATAAPQTDDFYRRFWETQVPPGDGVSWVSTD